MPPTVRPVRGNWCAGHQPRSTTPDACLLHLAPHPRRAYPSSSLSSPTGADRGTCSPTGARGSTGRPIPDPLPPATNGPEVEVGITPTSSASTINVFCSTTSPDFVRFVESPSPGATGTVSSHPDPCLLVRIRRSATTSGPEGKTRPRTRGRLSQIFVRPTSKSPAQDRPKASAMEPASFDLNPHQRVRAASSSVSRSRLARLRAGRLRRRARPPGERLVLLAISKNLSGTHGPADGRRGQLYPPNLNAQPPVARLPAGSSAWPRVLRRLDYIVPTNGPFLTGPAASPSYDCRLLRFPAAHHVPAPP